jgi:nitroimidazol reductase NimA-like FMN-containing flavoprotein (pyridoxamine 5'-phosphate oxidase superfamily)
MDLRMASDERLHFLREARVGVLGVDRPGRPPLLTPLWFAIDDGSEPTAVMVTSASSEKAGLLAGGGWASLCVHDDTPPYRFVVVGGPVRVEPPDPRVRRLIAERYMPAADVDGYLAMTADAPMVVLRLQLERWHSNDFARLASV